MSSWYYGFENSDTRPPQASEVNPVHEAALTKARTDEAKRRAALRAELAKEVPLNTLIADISLPNQVESIETPPVANTTLSLGDQLASFVIEYGWDALLDTPDPTLQSSTHNQVQNTEIPARQL